MALGFVKRFLLEDMAGIRHEGAPGGRICPSCSGLPGCDTVSIQGTVPL